MTAIIGYQNLLAAAASTVTRDTSDATDKPVANAYDYATHSTWQAAATGVAQIDIDAGAAVSADYLGIAAHDLTGKLAVSASAILIEAATASNYSDKATVAQIADTDVTVDESIFKAFTSVNKRYWRISINFATVADIGVIFLGERLTIPVGLGPGFAPPDFAPKDRVTNQMTEGGAFIGRVVQSQGVGFTMELAGMTPAFMRSDYLAFMVHARVKPFFVQWNNASFSSESAYCWNKGPIREARYSERLAMTHSLTLQGIK